MAQQVVPKPLCDEQRPSTCVEEAPFGVARGGGGAQFVHYRSRMTTDPRIPTMPGRSTSGFHQPGRHGLRQPRGAVRCSASRMNGELRSSRNRS